jgi:hypothetical protein
MTAFEEAKNLYIRLVKLLDEFERAGMGQLPSAIAFEYYCVAHGEKAAIRLYETIGNKTYAKFVKRRRLAQRFAHSSEDMSDFVRRLVQEGDARGEGTIRTALGRALDEVKRHHQAADKHLSGTREALNFLTPRLSKK